MAQLVESLPAKQETWIQSLGWEDSLEKEVATHSGILAWKIPWMEEPGRVHGVAKSLTRLSDFTYFLASETATMHPQFSLIYIYFFLLLRFNNFHTCILAH